MSLEERGLRVKLCLDRIVGAPYGSDALALWVSSPLVHCAEGIPEPLCRARER